MVYCACNGGGPALHLGTSSFSWCGKLWERWRAKRTWCSSNVCSSWWWQGNGEAVIEVTAPGFNFKPKYKALQFVIFFALQNLQGDVFKKCLPVEGWSQWFYRASRDSKTVSSAGAAVHLQLYHASPVETEVYWSWQFIIWRMAQQNILSRSVAICNSSTGNRMHLKVGELTVTCPLSNHISPNGLIPLSSLTVETRTLKENHECQHGAQQNSFRLWL